MDEGTNEDMQPGTECRRAEPPGRMEQCTVRSLKPRQCALNTLSLRSWAYSQGRGLLFRFKDWTSSSGRWQSLPSRPRADLCPSRCGGTGGGTPWPCRPLLCLGDVSRGSSSCEPPTLSPAVVGDCRPPWEPGGWLRAWREAQRWLRFWPPLQPTGPWGRLCSQARRAG